MIGASLLALGALCGAGGASRYRLAEVELVGPLVDLRLRVAERAETTLHAALVAGERRTVIVPLAAAPDARELELSELPESAGSARWIGWVRDELAGAEERFAALPLALRTRPRPLLPSTVGPRVPWAALLAALAALPLAWSLRRRPLACAAISLAAALGAVALARTGSTPPAAVRVLEGDAASGRWLAVDSARDALRLECAPPLALEVQPSHAFVRGTVELAALAGGDWTLACRGAGFLRCVELDPGPRTIDAASNGWGPIEALWLRSADGRWSARGAWEVGAPLPAALAGASIDPPGWINPALPLGTEILIARLAPGAFGGARVAPGALWLRRVGR